MERRARRGRAMELRRISDEVAYPVAVIFRRSLDTGCVPRDWRTANITPIFKKGSWQLSTCKPHQSNIQSSGVYNS